VTHPPRNAEAPLERRHRRVDPEDASRWAHARATIATGIALLRTGCTTAGPFITSIRRCVDASITDASNEMLTVEKRPTPTFRSGSAHRGTTHLLVEGFDQREDGGFGP